MPPYAGTKYSYEARSEHWHKSPVRLDITEAPVGEGGMRLVFHGAELDTAGHRIPSVLKLFKNLPAQAAQRACFDEAMTQMIADSYAQEYNRRGSAQKVGFLPVSVVRLERPFRGATFVCMEPLMSGRYVKHSDNAGHIGTSADVPQAFSHFSYEESNHLLVVCDIQGQGADLFTDPQIHSFDGKSFGLGNLGADGIRRFKRSHRCNAICNALRLPTLDSNQRPSAAPYQQRQQHQQQQEQRRGQPQRQQPAAAPRGGGRPDVVRVGAGHRVGGRRETDREMAERLQAEEYAQGDAASGRQQRRAWDARRYDDTITNAMRLLALQ
mmetsp:Transcript_45621/g.115332  ORF Transcript_45621/g.115332 Transcript_45621/m.115332 type:complete len:325 (-) Transcript_45621:187-1161(-)|eukprot:jgi/Tetstr1/457107/TSEL_043757.t1